MARLDVRNIKTACIWSDGGKHFRSACAISTVATRTLAKLCAEGSAEVRCPAVDIVFGIPAHFKNMCDGAQSHVRRGLAEIAKRELVSDIPQFIEKSAELWQTYQADPRRPSRLSATWVDFFPTVHKSNFVEQFCIQFHRSAFTEQISVCQCWTLRLNDQRRRGNPLYVDKKNVMTGVKFYASMLRDGRRVASERICIPKVEPPCEQPELEDMQKLEQRSEAEEFASGFAEAGSEEIGIAVKEVLGWSCSYRSAQPEKQSFAHWRARWTKARQSWISVPLEAPRHRRPQEEQRKRQEEWRQNRLVRKPR